MAVFPFEVLAQDDLAFLGKGVARMICSRVGDAGGVTVLCRLESFLESGITLSPSGAQIPAGNTGLAGINCIVKGTITQVGTQISTDAEVLDLRKGLSSIYFHETGTRMEDVLAHADSIAGKIKNYLLGIPIPLEPSSGSGMAPQPGTGAVGQVPWNAATGSAGGSLPAVQAPSSAQLPAAVGEAPLPGLQGQPRPVFRSRLFQTEFCGISAGDINGDGRTEIAVIDEHTLTILGFDGQNLATRAVFKGARYNTFKSVDVADINGNGRAEIFVTSVGRKGDLKSFVAEWSDNGLHILLRDTDWYYRTVRVHGEKRLFGQKSGYADVFSGGVMSLAWDGSDYAPTGPAALAGDPDIFSFTLGDVMGTGSDQTLKINKDGYLKLLDTGGETVWTSQSSFGSTAIFLGGEDSGKESSSTDRKYINSRIILNTVAPGIRPQILTVDNKDLSKGLLARFRKFTSGHITAMSWNTAGIVTHWDSTEVSGYIGDWGLEDVDGDKRPELFYINVADSGRFFKSTYSVIVVEKF
ncbi:MAG: FG-GAP-like repeat-containing protein [Pseudomonadota bacterium]